MATILRCKINGLRFRLTYEDGDDSWQGVVPVLTEAGIDVFVKYVGVSRRAAANPNVEEPPEE